MRSRHTAWPWQLTDRHCLLASKELLSLFDSPVVNASPADMPTVSLLAIGTWLVPPRRQGCIFFWTEFSSAKKPTGSRAEACRLFASRLQRICSRICILARLRRVAAEGKRERGRGASRDRRAGSGDDPCRSITNEFAKRFFLVLRRYCSRLNKSAHLIGMRSRLVWRFDERK